MALAAAVVAAVAPPYVLAPRNIAAAAAVAGTAACFPFTSRVRSWGAGGLIAFALAMLAPTAPTTAAGVAVTVLLAWGLATQEGAARRAALPLVALGVLILLVLLGASLERVPDAPTPPLVLAAGAFLLAAAFVLRTLRPAGEGS